MLDFKSLGLQRQALFAMVQELCVELGRERATHMTIEEMEDERIGVAALVNGQPVAVLLEQPTTVSAVLAAFRKEMTQ